MMNKKEIIKETIEFKELCESVRIDLVNQDIEVCETDIIEIVLDELLKLKE